MYVGAKEERGVAIAIDMSVANPPFSKEARVNNNNNNSLFHDLIVFFLLKIEEEEENFRNRKKEGKYIRNIFRLKTFSRLKWCKFLEIGRRRSY